MAREKGSPHRWSGLLDTLLSEKSTVEIRDSLGVAVLDVASEELRFRIAERMLEQSGTSRNVHTQQEGVLSYPVRACGEAREVAD